MEKRILEVYNFYLTKKDENKDKLAFTNVDGVDLLNYLFEHFVSYIDDLPADDSNKRIISFYRLDEKTLFRKRETTRCISGKIETGRYGKEEDVLDINSKDNKPVFTIHKNHSVQKPFFFLICLPDKKDKGFVILERDGQYGIKEFFTYIMRQFISSHFPDVKTKYLNFIEDKIVENYITKGDLSSISLTRNSLPADIAEKYGLGRFETEDFVVELKIKAKGQRRILGDAKNRIIEMFKTSPNGFFSYSEFEKIGFDENATIKVNSTYRNTSRTINLSDNMKFRPYYEINIETDIKGHSDFDIIEQKALDLLNSFELDLF